MKTIQEAVEQILRGPRVSRLLESLGVDSRRYWLLLDLFGQLSERGEMLDELGRNGVALKMMVGLCAVFSGLFSILSVVMQPALATYSSSFLILTALLLLVVLLQEAGNSLVNPVEGLVLAHQPINGATYTSAKLTHLARIVLYLVPALNAIPAFAGLLLKEAGWSYPAIHLLAAFAIGLVAACLCCALYGWLMRFVPARRLKAAAQLVGSMAFVALIGWQKIQELLAGFNLPSWLPAQAAARWSLGLALGAAGSAIVVLGIRTLSADYLIRVSIIAHGRSTAGAEPRRSRTAEVVAHFFGGQPGRAGFGFVFRMIRRDYQFRRQVVPQLILLVVVMLPLAARGWETDPFSGQFTTTHLLPHFWGILLFFVCSFLSYGSDFKGAWVFLLAPSRAFGPFALGVYAALWLQVIVISHVILLPFLAWIWGVSHAALFVAYSAAVASLYLALELRLIDGAPFSKQPDATRGVNLLLFVILGGLAAAIAVGLQYYFVFRSPGTVVMVTAVVGTAAFYLTRNSLTAFETSIRNHLALLSAGEERRQSALFFLHT